MTVIDGCTAISFTGVFAGYSSSFSTSTAIRRGRACADAGMQSRTAYCRPGRPSESSGEMIEVHTACAAAVVESTFAVNTTPVMSSTGPVGLWFPGIHFSAPVRSTRSSCLHQVIDLRVRQLRGVAEIGGDLDRLAWASAALGSGAGVREQQDTCGPRNAKGWGQEHEWSSQDNYCCVSNRY